MATERIKVTGFIPDLKVMYERASVVVSPLRFGAGTQNKVLEAMAMGIPIVSGKVGFDGLEIKNGEGVFLETEPEKFAHQVNAILESETLRKTAGEKGRLIAKQKFSWDIISLDLERYCQAQAL